MTCKNCGRELSGNSNFCEFCGTKVQVYCPRCGVEVNKKAAFCEHCGTILNPVANPAGPTVKSSGGRRTSEAIDGLRGILASPTALVLAILLSAALLFSLYGRNALLMQFLSSDLYGYIYEIASWMGDAIYEIDGMLYQMAWASQGGVTLIGIIKQWPLLLVIIGVWITWASARRTTDSYMKTGGFACIRFVFVFFFVISILELAAYTIVGIYAAWYISDSWFEDYIPYILIATAVGAAILVVVCCFYHKGGRSVKYVRETVEETRTGAEVSSGFITMLYILAVVQIIKILCTLRGTNFAGFISDASYAAALICAGILLKRCKVWRPVRKIVVESVRKCRNCGSESPATAKVCPFCGTKAADGNGYAPIETGNNVPVHAAAERHCPYCGKQISPTTAFCPYCSRDVRQPSPSRLKNTMGVGIKISGSEINMNSLESKNETRELSTETETISFTICQEFEDVESREEASLTADDSDNPQAGQLSHPADLD